MSVSDTRVPHQRSCGVASAEDPEVVTSGDFFNAFNHTQFANPNTTFATPSFAEITDTSVGPRVIQLALKMKF